MAVTSRSARRWGGALLGVVLFGVALWVLWAELRRHSPEVLASEIRRLPPLRLALSLLASAFGYTALTGYDMLSLRYLGHRLPYRRVALASFVGYAFANSLPLSVVTGASVRFRLYTAYGLSAAEVARLVALNTVTYALGLLATAGLAFALQPVVVPGFLRLPLHSARPLGLLCLLVLGAYLTWSARAGGGAPLRAGAWELPRLGLARAGTQVTVSALDWVLSSAALYVLLPGSVPFTSFLGVFLLGQVAALVAQIPGGLGVFEAVLLWSLAPAVGGPTVFAALVAYRLTYFLLPLTIAAVIWGAHEARTWLRRPR